MIENWLDWIQDLDFNTAAITWCVMWGVATAFTAWNCVDGWHDWMTNIREGEPGEYIAGSRWFFRQDLLKTIALVMVMFAGVFSVFRQTELARLMLFAGGAILTLNQIMNRIDRVVVKRLADAGRDQRRKQRMHELED